MAEWYGCVWKHLLQRALNPDQNTSRMLQNCNINNVRVWCFDESIHLKIPPYICMVGPKECAILVFCPAKFRTGTLTSEDKFLHVSARRETEQGYWNLRSFQSQPQLFSPLLYSRLWAFPVTGTEFKEVSRSLQLVTAKRLHSLKPMRDHKWQAHG